MKEANLQLQGMIKIRKQSAEISSFQTFTDICGYPKEQTLLLIIFKKSPIWQQKLIYFIHNQIAYLQQKKFNDI